MALETPNSGTLRTAQEKVMGLLDPESEPQETATGASPEEPIEEPTADEGLLNTPDTEDDYPDEEEETPSTFKHNINCEALELTEE